MRFLLTTFLHSKPSILCIPLPIPGRALQPIDSLHNQEDKGMSQGTQVFGTYFNVTDGYDVRRFIVRLRQGQK